MYDLMEVQTYKPKGDYRIDADAFRDGGKDEMIAALDAAETAKHRKKMVRWRSIILSFTKLVAPPKQAASGRSECPIEIVR
jgi:hypothetical protein